MKQIWDAIEVLGPIVIVAMVIGYFLCINWFRMTGREVDRGTKLFLLKFLIGAPVIGLLIGFAASSKRGL